MHRLTLILFVALFFAARPARAQSYEFAVEHDHTFGDCRGKLIITPERIEYRTENKEHSRAWRYTDIKQIKIVSPKKVELASYEDLKWRMGLDRAFEFKLLEGEITSEISALLVERAARPVVTSVAPKTEDAPAFEVPVKHLRRFGGCSGTLKIYPDHVSTNLRICRQTRATGATATFGISANRIGIASRSSVLKTNSVGRRLTTFN